MLNKTTIAIVALVLIAGSAVFIGTQLQKPQTSDTSAQVTTDQCTLDGGIIWGGSVCPTGYTSSGTISGISDGSQTSGDIRIGGDGGSTGGDTRITQGLCCKRITIETPIPTLEITPEVTPGKDITPTLPESTITPSLTLTPTPTPPCPDCSDPIVLPIPNDPQGAPSCDNTCDFDLIKQPDQCFATGEPIRVRLSTHGCLKCSSTSNLQCGKPGDIITCPGQSGGISVVELFCDPDITPTAAPQPTNTQTRTTFIQRFFRIGDAQQSDNQIQTGDDSSTTDSDTTPPLEFVCRKQFPIVCGPTPTIPIPSEATPDIPTPEITDKPSVTPGSCKLPKPRLSFECPNGCTRLKTK